jgi:hypothetical protein
MAVLSVSGRCGVPPRYQIQMCVSRSGPLIGALPTRPRPAAR